METYPTHASERHARAEPRFLNPLVIVALAGLALVAVGQIVMFFSIMNTLPGETVAPLFFWTFGTVTLGVGLALGAVLVQHIGPGARVAMLIAGAYFLVVMAPLMSGGAFVGLP